MKDGKVVFSRGYGVRELGKSAPVDTSTLFAIASTTKAMTAASIGMLVDEGKLKCQVMVPPDEFYPTAELTKPHWTTYGLGWFQEDYKGRMLNFHTGSLNGMVAIIGLVQDARFGVYVLANVDHAEVRHALM